MQLRGITYQAFPFSILGEYSTMETSHNVCMLKEADSSETLCIDALSSLL